MAGLALLVSAAGCAEGGGEDGPAPPTQGEQAALADAQSMLDAREANAEDAEPEARGTAAP
ncbi:hypothetical protein [Aurantiacibacter poecillastricola]|uniref:hypothetical protein n=1 Tax=Aurantiacibacter poecillastricola TaxID=3064385 RepID=UPI00273FF187|nr:hypothetical protein [Aurantiacibacter sp. 219JJ12-13]MDP5260749.1 hypothetical protein [Aurantiacibacter sp. 219JJ12-13]